MAAEARVLTVEGVDALIGELRGRGYDVVGPTVRDGAIVNGSVTTIADLPRGVGDTQDAGTYRLRERGDDAYFGFAAGAQSAKPVFFPADQVMFRTRVAAGSVAVEPDASQHQPVALLGVRGCDLKAVEIHDAVLGSRGFADAHYRSAREGAFVVAVTCGDPGGTCFCASVDSGPKPAGGYDLCLTEVLAPGAHYFVVDVGTERGKDVIDTVGAAVAEAGAVRAAEAIAKDAALRMGRELDTDGLKYLMYASAESSRWDEIATRCLSCTNCTLVCPTCFCTSVDDVTDLTGTLSERHRVWDSCFTEGFTYIHGGSVRQSGRSRYRQWMTHKLAAWEDQFGMLGCVGCGRCITWCPAAIDITAEAASLRGAHRPGGTT